MPFHSVLVGSHSAWPILQGSKALLLEGAVSVDCSEFICTGDWSPLSINQILLPNGLRNHFFLSFFNIFGIVDKGLWTRTSIVSKLRKSYNMLAHCTPWWQKRLIYGSLSEERMKGTSRKGLVACFQEHWMAPSHHTWLGFPFLNKKYIGCFHAFLTNLSWREILGDMMISELRV